MRFDKKVRTNGGERMPKYRSPRPGSKYYLPREKFRLTVAYCLTYKLLKAEIAEITTIKGRVDDGMPKSGGITDPVFTTTMRVMELRQKVAIIEDAVKLCAGDALYPFMLQAITDESCGWSCIEAKRAPLSRSTYIRLRRRIYYEIGSKL